MAPGRPAGTAIIGPDRNVVVTFGIREPDALVMTVVQLAFF